MNPLVIDLLHPLPCSVFHHKLNTLDSSTAKEDQALVIKWFFSDRFDAELNIVNAVMDSLEVRKSLQYDRGYELALVMTRT